VQAPCPQAAGACQPSLARTGRARQTNGRGRVCWPPHRSTGHEGFRQRQGAAGLPTVFVFEGGYAVAEVGVNAANVLEGFSQQGA
jgi:hypothetical protein